MMTVLLLLACQWAVAQNVAEFGRQEQETESLKLLKSEIDSITFELQASGDAYDQLIWTHDSLYRMNLTDDYGVKFSQVTLPDVYVLTEGIGDWSEMWISRQGNLMALKFKKNSEEILDNAALFISGEMGNTSHIACSDFYENGMPKSMLIDDSIGLKNVSIFEFAHTKKGLTSQLARIIGKVCAFYVFSLCYRTPP